MSNKNSFDEMHERILQGALEIFSAKGYSAATIKDISTRVGCNSITIFRHFEDKQTLFHSVVERFHRLEFDDELIRSKLSYTNVHADLATMAGLFFEVLARNLHIMRIYINDGPFFERIAKYIWYLPAPLKNFVAEYIETVYPDKISSSDASLISELCVAYVVRTCLRLSVHDGVHKFTKKIADDAKLTMAPSVDMIMDLLRMHVRGAK